jgi:membrane protein DedA with SNARE-associated domain
MEHFLTSYGYLALIIFGFIEACCIPISSEVTFAAAGALAATHHQFSLALVIIIGAVAEIGGSMTAYWAGRRGGHQLLDRYGKYVLVSHSDLDRAERFFANRGSWTVLVSRALPLVRTFAGFGAGVVEVPFAPFAIFNLIGTTLWAIALSLIGYSVGGTMTKLFHSFSLVGIAIVALFLIALVAHRVHGMRKEARSQEAEAASTEDGPATADAKVPSHNRPAGAHRSGRGPGA